MINASRFLHIAATLALSTVVLIGGLSCSSKKKSTGSGGGPALINEWPEEANGRYNILIEFRNCGFFNCTWDSLGVIEDAICGGILLAGSDSAQGFIVTSIKGVISDTLFHVVSEGTIRIDDDLTCRFRSTLSTRETGLPPSHDYWQIIETFEFLDCEYILPSVIRFTFSRVGDADCTADAAGLPSWREVPLRVPVGLP